MANEEQTHPPRRSQPAAVFLLSLALLPGACDRGDRPRQAGGRLSVFVSILPQAYFLERLGGQHASVEVLVGPGQTPHTFEPSLKQMARLAQARLYFRVGVPFEEALVPKLTSAHPHLRVIDTREGIDPRPAPEEHAHEGEAGPEHDAGEMDPHVWMSPRLVSRQAETICRALCEADPPHQHDYRENLKAFQADLAGLDARIAEALAPMKGRTLFVFHPAFGYFAAAYGLRQQAVETGGKRPSARHIRKLIDQARADGVKVIFVQPQFDKRTAETIAGAIGGAVVPIDPLGRDYIANLDDVARKVRSALSPKR